MLFNGKSGIVVTDGRIPDDGAVLLHGKGHDCFIERKALRRVHFAEGIASRRNRNTVRFAVFVSILPINHGSAFVLHLNQRTRQRDCACDVQFGERHLLVNQLVVDRFDQQDAKHGFILRHL